MTPAQTARLIALPDSLRAWAREEPVVRLCLARHVLDGVPLGAALAAVVHAMPDARFELYDRLLAAAGWTGSIPPDWCAAMLAGGHRCHALGVVRGQGGRGLCVDCAEVAGRAGGRAVG